jgi:hypothetical protein
MSAGLVSSWIEAKVEHESALIIRSIDIGASKRVWQVVAVESRASGRKDLNTVSLKLQSVNSLG